MFYHYLELHHSQTDAVAITCLAGFTTIWNYITLKPDQISREIDAGFTTIWNYITLKH